MSYFLHLYSLLFALCSFVFCLLSWLLALGPWLSTLLISQRVHRFQVSGIFGGQIPEANTHQYRKAESQHNRIRLNKGFNIGKQRNRQG